MRVLIIGGSDAGIEAGLSAAAAGVDVTLLVADACPNFSVCGIPYYLSGEVADWRQLAHRDLDALQAAGLDLRLDTNAVRIDIAGRQVQATGPAGQASFGYDRLIVATGAVPAQPPITGLDQLGPGDGVHVLHSIGDSMTLAETLARDGALPVVIVGGGYIGLEMAEALTRRGVAVTVVEALPQLMSTVDPEVAAEVRQTMERHGVRVHTGTAVRAISREGGALMVHAAPGPDGAARSWPASAVLVVTGVRPNTDVAAAAGLTLGVRGAIAVDRGMRTAPDIFAAGDCVHTYHRLLDQHAYLPLGSTAHKQGRVAGVNAAGGEAVFAGSLGTQVVRVFDRVIAATGLRAAQARQAGFDPLVVEHTADDHKAYYPGATPLRIRLTGDRNGGRLLGAQLFGHYGAEIAKRVDILATAISYGATVADLPTLDLSYTPPLGSPFDAVQHAADAWTAAART